MADDGGRGRATLRELFEVFRDPHLEPEEKVLWGLYRSYESPNKWAYPGDELLAEHLDRSPRTVRRLRGRLLEAGYLEQQLRGPKPARYRSVTPCHQEEESSEDPWGCGDLPDGDGFPSRFFLKGVQEVLWLGTDPPPGAPDGWTIRSGLSDLERAWKNLGTQGLIGRLWGLRYLADANELPGVEPGSGFTLALLKKHKGEGYWSDAEQAYTGHFEASEGGNPLQEVAGDVLAEIGGDDG